jgi:phage terminase large subunit-like protein
MSALVEHRRVMRDDLFKFGFVVCNNLTPDQSTCQLHHDIKTFHHSEHTLTALVSPRGHGKTTWASTISTAHDIAYDRENVIIIVKKTFGQAVTDLQNIVNVVKYNARFKKFFGKREFLIDRQDRCYIYNPYTGHKTWIEAKGAGQSIRGIVVDGKRPSKILLDDFEDENNTLTVEQRQKVRSWITAQVMPSLDPHKGKLLAIGTIVHYDSWLYNLWEKYSAAIKEGRETAWKMIFHVIEEDGVPLWPERFTLKYIKSLRASYEELGRLDEFYQEYYNIPFNPDNAGFKREMITYFTGPLISEPRLNYMELAVPEQKEPLLVPVDVVIGIDPSSGKSKDYTGIVVNCTAPDGKRYLAYANREKLAPDQLVDRLFGLYLEYRPRLIVIEEAAMQIIIQYWLRQEMRVRNIYLPLKGDPVPNTMSKETKLFQALQPIYSSGVMHHRSQQTALEEELFTFPKSKHDDIMDALYLASKYSIRPLDVPVMKEKQKKKLFVHYNWKTGMREDGGDNW